MGDDHTPKDAPMKRTGPQRSPFTESPFALKLTLPDGLLLAGTVGFIMFALIDAYFTYGQFNTYTTLRGLHFHLSRYGLVMAGVMLALAVYIGIIRKEDVTPWFRRGTYIIFVTMMIQAIIGAILMFVLNIPSGQPEHIIYGFGTVLALPFFIFVETTAQKRPAMGSYIWGFTLMIGVIVRSISTGPGA